ncbi:hypothetical protein HA402_006826 [Bradysia odoriphaga]|nr:hypothetical protein HA402_006826 [Bradysia odoriphaga]
MTDDKAEDSTQEVKPEDDKKESKGNSVKGGTDNGAKKKAKDDKSDSDAKNDEDSAEEDGDDTADNDEKSDTKKTSDKKKPAANNDKKKSVADGKKDDGKSNSKNSNSANDKKDDDDGTAKSSNKKESAMSLGEIARIDSYITNTKVDGLQVLHSICFTGVAKPNMIKNKLRKFSGFEFDADSDEYSTKLEAVQKIDVAKLKAVCEGLTLDKKVFYSCEMPTKIMLPDHKNESESEVPNETLINNEQPPPQPSKWKRDVWHRVDLDFEKKRSSGSQMKLDDCKAIQVKMALKNAERMRQKQVRLEMAQRQCKLNELEEMMTNMKISNREKSAKKLERNLLLKEEHITRLVQQIELNSKLAEEQAQREIEDHSKKVAEKITRLKRFEEVRGYFESIKSLKDLFIVQFEKFVKTCISNQQHLKQFTQYTENLPYFLTRYETIIKLVNAGQLTSAEVEALETICDEIKMMQRSVDSEVEEASEELTRANTKLEEEKQLKEQQQQEYQQQQKQQEQQQQQVQQSVRSVDTTDRPNVIAMSSERLSHYQTVMSFYESYADSVKPLQNDVNLKKFRVECIKCVNILLNSISSVDAAHLKNRYDRLALMLSGNSVEIGGTRVTPSQHPLGIRFVNLLVAKMFVKQADTAMGTLNSKPGFPIASLIVSLWQKFSDFGTLFLAYIYKQSPLMVPYHIQQVAGQSDEDYLKFVFCSTKIFHFIQIRSSCSFFRSIGFIFKDNICENQGSFLKRLTGVVRLYSSVIITKTRQSVNKPHPHGIEFGWIWLTSVLNLDPIADVSATMVHEFILIAGSELYARYNTQFLKIIVTIHQQYMARLNEMETGGPKSRLQHFIRKILEERKIEPPEGTLAANFW